LQTRYKDTKYFIYPQAYSNTADLQAKIRAGREAVNVNGRLTQWNVMVHSYRHDIIIEHVHWFHAVINVTQIMIDSGEKLFDV